MGRLEELAARYRGHIGAPWQRNLAGDQKAIFVVYPKTDERKLRARMELFEMATTSTTHRWRLFDLTATFARWMADTDYRDAYFEEPETLAMKLRSDFVQYATGQLRETLTAEGVDEDTVVTVQGVACLFGFTRVSLVLKEVVKDIRGRLVVFFPGQYEDGLIRILESYLGNASSTTQPAAWVSGFYGSGKSHLLKMFRHLWVNTPFADGATARGLARLPQEVQDLLRELDTLGRRSG